MIFALEQPFVFFEPNEHARVNLLGGRRWYQNIEIRRLRIVCMDDASGDLIVERISIGDELLLWIPAPAHLFGLHRDLDEPIFVPPSVSEVLVCLRSDEPCRGRIEVHGCSSLMRR